MYQYEAKVIKIVDGDTIDLDIDLGLYVHIHIRCRLLGIDAHETRTTDQHEKALGLEEKRYLENMIANKSVLINTKKRDKYGRWLGEIYCDGKFINTEMELFINRNLQL